MSAIGSGEIAADWRGAPPAGAAPRPVSRALVPAAVIALTAAAAVLRFAGLGHQGLWYDEALTRRLVGMSGWRMWQSIPLTESNPPLYYVAAWAWTHVVGTGNTGLRSLSAVAGTATVPALFLAGRRLRGDLAGLATAALAAFSPILVWYSQEGRNYALLVLLSALLVIAWLAARARPDRGRLLAWGLLAALALATHYYAAGIVAPQAAALIWWNRSRWPPLAWALAPPAITAAALTPLILEQTQDPGYHWIDRIPLTERLDAAAGHFVIGFAGHAPTLPLVLALAGLALSVALLATGDRRSREAAAVAGALAGGVLLTVVVLDVAGSGTMISRNLLEIWAPLALVVGIGLAVRRVGAIGVALLCASGLIVTTGVASTPSLQRPDWRPLARSMGAPRKRVVVTLPAPHSLPLALYQPGVRGFPPSGVVTREIDVVAVRAVRMRACWWGALCNLETTGLPSSRALPGWRAGPVRFAPPFRWRAFVSRRPHLVTVPWLLAHVRSAGLGDLRVQLPPRHAAASAP